MNAKIIRILDGNKFLGCRIETSLFRRAGYQFWQNHLTEKAAIAACESRRMDWSIEIAQPPYPWLNN